MVTEEQIQRINELARLSKERALTPDEKEEQATLRRAYLESVKTNLRAQLDRVEIKD